MDLKNSIQDPTAVETPFYGNNVMRGLCKEAYYLAKDSPGTIELSGMPVFEAEKWVCPKGQRCYFLTMGQLWVDAAAGRIVGEPNVKVGEYATKLRRQFTGLDFAGYIALRLSWDCILIL